MDVVDHSTRSRMMSGIRRSNTRPEILVRKLLHAAGLRFRLHRRDLPGRPDLVLPRYEVAIFVHGCFWHAHVGCRFAKTPSSNTDFWIKKLSANRARDERDVYMLRQQGWRVALVWECATRVLEPKSLQRVMVRFIKGRSAYTEVLARRS